jgi:hypothetical protein
MSSDPRPITRELPTEEGLYLFAGEREGLTGFTAVDDLGRTHVELVTVARDASGALRYIGRDFFYRPSKSIGAWVRVSDLASSVEAIGRDVLKDALVGRIVASMPVHPGAKDESSLLRDLTGSWTPGDGPRSEAAREVLAYAVSTGALERVERSWGGWEYRLPQTGDRESR